ncbi:CDP-glycerol glycerophosphotransferase family protein, partial [Staphylococcus pseudintermedius]
QSERGVYIEPSELPGPVTDTIQEVIEMIQDETYRHADVRDKYLKFKHQFVGYEDGQVTDRFIEKVFLNHQGQSLNMNHRSEKKKLLLYPGGMKNNGITTSVMNLLSNIDYQKYDVTIFLNNTNNNEQLNNLKSIDGRVRII